MTTGRRAEIIGGGFAGLALACALAQRGWRARVHERGTELRTTGAGIYIYENGLRVLEALGAFEGAVKGASIAQIREVRDKTNRTVSVHHWNKVGRVVCVVRQRLINALADAARKSGAEIITDSEAVSATAGGEVLFADGRRETADLIVGADGVNSRIRDSLGLVAKRKAMPDGAIRVLLDKTDEERARGDTGTTIEYWSDSRRILYTPCSDDEIYVALTMLDRDAGAKSTPVDVPLWRAAFPHLAPLIDRIGARGRYDRFEIIKLKSWSAGCVAILGDAAHALPPNLGQGGGCAMMNALALAVHLEHTRDVASGLAAWERAERPLTEHTQRMSVFFGLPTTWPAPLQRLFFSLAGRSAMLGEMRMRTARHHPTGALAPPVS
ncbi:NAD(P)/FAD-dependent oxidoreductase [Terrarubrum flagellatum]|uniref:FAD-dependent oxidoreductase n=1 Tax=Terrirubrum flagellatum TaxID=2895980 RepID=UPI0031452E7D